MRIQCEYWHPSTLLIIIITLSPFLVSLHLFVSFTVISIMHNYTMFTSLLICIFSLTRALYRQQEFFYREYGSQLELKTNFLYWMNFQSRVLFTVWLVMFFICFLWTLTLCWICCKNYLVSYFPLFFVYESCLMLQIKYIILLMYFSLSLCFLRHTYSLYLLMIWHCTFNS